MIRFYVETNFLIAIATGRDSKGAKLLADPPAKIKIAIPDICIMEALSFLEGERKRRLRFKEELKLQISQLSRDNTSSHAHSLLLNLNQAKIENDRLANDIESRLRKALNQIATNTELLSLNPSTLQKSLQEDYINKDLTDNLILHCIVQDALKYPSQEKIFLSENTKDFNTQEVKTALLEVGIQYFSSTQFLLDWINAQSN